MISIDRLEEMAIEELETKLNNWKEQVELQSNFIYSLLKATNNSEWLNKTILDDEASEIIEKIELDYAQLDQLKADNEELKRELMQYEKDVKDLNYFAMKLKQTLTEIKEIVGIGLVDGLQPEEYSGFLKILQAQILQKISEVEDEHNG